MKLAAKLILIFLFGVLAIVSLFAWQTIRRQHAWEEQRRESHANDLAETLAPAIEKAYKEGGTITIQQAVEVYTRRLRGPEVRWVDGEEAASMQTRTSSRQTSSVSITDAKGNRKAYSYIPIKLGDDMEGSVEVAEPLEKLDAFTRESVVASVLSLLGVATLSGVVIYFGGVQLVGRPLNRLISQVNLIGEGQLDQSPVLTTSDELGRLAAAISQMSHRISQQRDTIRHTDRLGTIGTLAAGMAHELGTPLNVVSGRAGLIASGKLSDEEIVASANTIKSEADRMTTIIRQLLDFARQKPSPHARLRLNEVVLRTCNLTRLFAAKANVELVQHLPDAPVYIDGDAAQMQQVLTNLITNAIAAMPDGGTTTISLSTSKCGRRPTMLNYEPDQVMPSPGTAVLRVSDTGTGIDSDDIQQIFEPFYTTKDVGQGTGLGLSIAYGIVREHGGEIQVTSKLGQGTIFTVSFPLRNDESLSGASLS